MAEDSCKGNWEVVENVWKMVQSRGKVRKKSGNFEIENEWQPCMSQPEFTVYSFSVLPRIFSSGANGPMGL